MKPHCYAYFFTYNVLVMWCAKQSQYISYKLSIYNSSSRQRCWWWWSKAECVFTLSACEIWREFVVDVKKYNKKEGKEEKPQEWNKCSIAAQNYSAKRFKWTSSTCITLLLCEQQRRTVVWAFKMVITTLCHCAFCMR